MAEVEEEEEEELPSDGAVDAESVAPGWSFFFVIFRLVFAAVVEVDTCGCFLTGIVLSSSESSDSLELSLSLLELSSLSDTELLETLSLEADDRACQYSSAVTHLAGRLDDDVPSSSELELSELEPGLLETGACA